MKTNPPRRGSTLRFAAGIIAAVLLITGLTLACITANLKAEIEARRDRLHRAGIPMTLAEMAPPAIPDNENAAPLYQQAIDLIDARGVGHVSNMLMVKRFVDRGLPGRRAQLRAQVTPIIARSQLALDLLREGARRPHCRLPLEWTADPFDFTVGKPWQVRNGAYLLLARAIIRKERGDTADAVADTRACLRISSHLAEQPLTPAARMSAEVRSSTLGVLQELIENQYPDAAACRALFDGLAERRYQALFRRALFGDNVVAMWYFDTAQHDPARMRRALKINRADMRALTACYLSPLGSLVQLREEVSYLDRFERALALYKLPYRAAARGHEKLVQELARAPKYEQISKLWAPIDFGPEMPMRRDSVLARQGAIQVALALKAYQRRYGTYPRALDALRRYPGWDLPEDPFGGKPFGYRREGKGFMLYSWGPDLKDEGGYPGQYPAWAYFSTPPPSGDIVWHYRR